jgi:hypothetical protein
VDALGIADTRARPQIPAWATKFPTGEVITTITLSEKKPEVAVKVMNNEVCCFTLHNHTNAMLKSV